MQEMYVGYILNYELSYVLCTPAHTHTHTRTHVPVVLAWSPPRNYQPTPAAWHRPPPSGEQQRRRPGDGTLPALTQH